MNNNNIGNASFSLYVALVKRQIKCMHYFNVFYIEQNQIYDQKQGITEFYSTVLIWRLKPHSNLNRRIDEINVN